MAERRVYSRSEVSKLRTDLRQGLSPICPRCEVALAPRPVAARSDIGYVRNRVLWICGHCGRSAVLEAASPA